MFGGGTVRLARVLGIDITASFTWFVVLFLMIWGLSGSFKDALSGYSEGVAYMTAVLGALLFFLSLTLHELGHAIVARRNGIEISGIELWFFGGLAKMTRDTDSPGEEFRIAAAGPAVTLLIVVLCAAAAALASDSSGFRDAAELSATQTTPALALLGWLALVNAFLFVFNMVPAFPLDGGRITRAIAWKITGDRGRGTRFSAALGQLFGYLLMGLGLYWLLTDNAFNGLWFLVLGWFLGQAARGAAVQSRYVDRIEGITAGDLMDRQPVWIPADTRTIDAQDEFFARYRWPWFPVADPVTGAFRGLLHEGRVDAALAEGRPTAPVGELAELDGGAQGGGAVSVPEDTPVEHLLGSDGLRERGALMVVDADGRLAGVVTLDQVRRAIAAAAPSRPL
ncbi:MAG TPA: site-2 protease family protein [Solirubrobacteraceae bacterium]|nr:site-2 protease family protein [Solirubrobacteraceae bacterium]